MFWMSLLRRLRKSGRALGAAVMFLGLGLGAVDAQQVQQAPRPLNGARVATVSLAGPATGQVLVPLNKSQILQVDRAFSEVTVGSPEIADVVPLTRQSVYVLGKKLGSTNLMFMGDRNRPLAVVDLVVTHDVEGLKQKLFEVLPDERIEVRSANEGIVISGQVSSPDKLARAMAVAQQYAPDKVTNLLSVAGSSQVMLEVKFAEFDREASKALGFSVAADIGIGATRFAFLSGFPGSVLGQETTPFASAATLNGDLATQLDVLERKGLVSVLAEPNLVVLSGDSAAFLAGGEFPIPIAQALTGGTNAITVEFKQFGVGLNFTPTVIGKDLINLVIKTEVSDIDRALTVQSTFPGGVVIPGLRVRRTETTVEVRDGQSFAISGLLRQDFADTVAQLPWLGDLPVLGALFRSSNYRQKKTELVVFITPRLVKPVPAGTLAIPHDFVALPSEQDLFLGGRIDRSRLGRSAAAGIGGVTGPHGYVIK
ncbi:MAG TPA: type II and III secretion system protein family protein [Alphaproteobacteria bacterium]